MSSDFNDLYEFGEFRLDAREQVLRRGEDVIILPPKVFETLLMLVRRKGGIVSKNEMLGEIWADTFVEESNLTQNIYTLRKILGNDASGKQIIETVARRGYRIAVPVRVLETDEVPAWAGKTADEFFLHQPEIKAAVEPYPAENVQAFAPLQTNVFDFIETQKPFVKNSLEKRRARFAFRRLIFAVAGLAILTAGAFYWFAPRSEQKQEAGNAPVEQVRFQRLTDSGDIIHPTISPNGELLVFTRVGSNEQSVWLKQIATGSEKEVLPPSKRGYGSLAFSPDGNYLFFRETDGKAIFQTPVLGGTPKRTAENVWGDFGVSPDGRQLAFIRRKPQEDASAVILSNIDGSGERELALRKQPFGYNEIAPAWSPDGSTLIVVGSSKTEARPLLLAIDAATGGETELKTPRWRDITRFLWMPDGKRLIVVARSLTEAASQLWMYDNAGGGAQRLTNDLENYFWLSLSADGRKLVTRQQQMISNLWLLPDGDLQKARQITTGGRARDGIRGLIWMPDGRIVFTAIEETVANLHSLDPATGVRVRLLANPAQDSTYPSTSADGRFITYTSNMKIGRQIWRMDADGRNQKQLTTSEDLKETAFAPAISPDGREVYFIRRTAEPAAIWKMSIEGENLQLVAKISGAVLDDFLAVSPDGKWLAFRQTAGDGESQTDESPQKIGVIPVDGSLAPRLYDLPFRRAVLRWAKDSNAVYYLGGTNNSTLRRQPLEGGASQKILEFPDRIFNFSFSPDGKNLTVARGRLLGDAILITNLP